MYAHQVVADLQKRLHLYDSSLQALLANSISLIQDAKKFHLGEIDDISDLFERTLDHFGEERIPFFMGEAAVNVRNPYKLCWYYFSNQLMYNRIHTKAKDLRTKPADERIRVPRKAGYLVQEILTEVFVFSCFGEKEDGWYIDSTSYVVIIDEVGSELLEKYGDQLDSSTRGIIDRYTGDGNVYPLQLVPSELANPQWSKKVENHLMLLNCTLMLLNTRNIGTAPNYPPRQLNKAREKRNKKPIDVYHTLILKPPPKKQREGIIEPKGLWTMKFHTRKGHFAYYGPERPLFGHYVGRVWIPAYECGDPSLGRVEKDYKVQLPKKLK